MATKAEKLLSSFGGTIGAVVANRPPAIAPSPAGPAAADRYAGAIKARSFAEMPVDRIDVDPQVRETFDPDDIARLAASIRRFGQLAPIRVRHDPGRDRWVVLVGERRLRACRLAGLERIRVEFVERAMTEADVLAEQTVENSCRADLTPVEKARAYRRLMDLNDWTADALAETLGVEPTSVYRCLALLKLPEDVAARVDSGEIKATAAYELTKLPTDEDQRAVADAASSATALDHAATVAEVRRRKGTGKGRGARSRPKKVTSRTLPHEPPAPASRSIGSARARRRCDPVGPCRRPRGARR